MEGIRHGVSDPLYGPMHEIKLIPVAKFNIYSRYFIMISSCMCKLTVHDIFDKINNTNVKEIAITEHRALKVSLPQLVNKTKIRNK